MFSYQNIEFLTVYRKKNSLTVTYCFAPYISPYSVPLHNIIFSIFTYYLYIQIGPKGREDMPQTSDLGWKER